MYTTIKLLSVDLQAISSNSTSRGGSCKFAFAIPFEKAAVQAFIYDYEGT